MPGLSGPELTSRLVELRPGLKVIYMSGYTDNSVVLHGVLHAEVAFVQKPFNPHDVLRTVRAVLAPPTRWPLVPGALNA